MSAFETVILDARYAECSQCYAPASWMFRHLCGEVMLTCDRHRIIVDTNNPGPSGRGYFTCPKCRLPAPQPINWRVLS